MKKLHRLNLFDFQVGNSFSVSVGPVPEGENCDLTIVQGDESVILSDVLFGDVYVCSGKRKLFFFCLSDYI